MIDETRRLRRSAVERPDGSLDVLQNPPFG